jgi:hypothetical protein
MHLKALLTVGAATASLLAGTAGTALIGHAALAPSHHKTVQPAPHHVSNPNHPGGYKGTSGTHRHTSGNTTGKPKPHHKKPKASPTPTPHP